MCNMYNIVLIIGDNEFYKNLNFKITYIFSLTQEINKEIGQLQEPMTWQGNKVQDIN